MSNSFYRAFEDRHRGSRELIKSRLGAYLPFLVPLARFAAPTALDLGCGRGEWLELLGEAGFAARGVDLDEGMLAACRERGLDVATEDALASLRAQPDASLALISAFHFVEHIPFAGVQELIREAMRVLQPGGLLIMETPNPENLVVATSGFYMDPSHVRPIPPMLLEFVVEFGGFWRHRVVRLQESPHLHDASHLDLMNVLNGASPDYSVVSQKAAEVKVTASFDDVFAAPFGLDLATLAQRYQVQQDTYRSDASANLAQLSERIASAETSMEERAQRTLGAVSEAQTDITRLNDRIVTAEMNVGKLFERTLDTIAEAQTVAKQLQLELREGQQREREGQQRERERETDMRAQARMIEVQAEQLRAAEIQAQQCELERRREAEAWQIEHERMLKADARQRELEQEEQVRQREFEQEEQARQREREQEEQAWQHELVLQEQASQRALEIEAAARAQAMLIEEQADLARAADAQLQHVQWQLNEMTVRTLVAEQQVRDLHASTSWRVMRPARAAMTLLRRPLGAADVARMVKARNKTRAANILMPLVRNLARRPAARNFAMRALTRFPALEGRLRSLAYRALHGAPAYVPPVELQLVERAAEPVSAVSVPIPPNMSRSAQHIYAQLQRNLYSDDHSES